MRSPGSDPGDRKRWRFALQGEARWLLPGSRTAVCLRSVQSASDGPKVHVTAKGAVFGGLQTCGSVWACPVCAAKVSERRRKELDAAVAAHRAAGGVVWLVTYTRRHGGQDGLVGILDGLLEARRAVRSGRAGQAWAKEVGLVGSVRALEVTHGAAGWHPHVHELLFLEGRPEQAGRAIMDLRLRWCAEVDADPIWAIDVRVADEDVAAYVAKWGREPRWTAGAELAKQVAKRGRGGGRSPLDLLASSMEGDGGAGQLWREYAEGMRGRRQLCWSTGLRSRLGLGQEAADEELAADVGDEVEAELISLTMAEWQGVLASDARAEVLLAAQVGGRPAVMGLVRVLAPPGRVGCVAA